MKAAYLISESDYLKAMKLHARPSLRGIAIMSAVILILLAIVVAGPPSVGGPVIAGLIGFATVLLLIRYVLMPVRYRRHYRRYKLIHKEVSVELLEDGIRFNSPNGEGKLPWKDIFKWRQNEDYILVYVMPRLFYIVPKSIGREGFDVSTLASSLARHVGNAV